MHGTAIDGFGPTTTTVLESLTNPAPSTHSAEIRIDDYMMAPVDAGILAKSIRTWNLEHNPLLVPLVGFRPDTEPDY